MRSLRRWILGAAVLLYGTVAASAQANQYCQAFFDQMADDTLYAARCAQAGCLDKVVNTGGPSALQGADGAVRPLKKGQYYNFIYKTPSSGGTPNSLVVVQIKQLDATARATVAPSPVRMRRYALDFACYRGRQDVSLPDLPPATVRGGELREIDYNKYDQFHRDGFTSSEEDRFFQNNLHLRYFNGRTCVSTLDPARRAQFLLHDHKQFSGRFEQFFISVGLTANKANAGELETVRKYARLKVLVSNYRRGSQPQGCAAFSTKAGGSNSIRLDVVVRDIEQQVQAGFPGYDTSRSWSFLLE
jgi:hypothetical protein